MKIKIKDEDDMELVLRESLHIMKNLRHYSKIWKEKYGAKANDNMVYWQGKADEFLDRLKVSKTINMRSVKIEIDDDVLFVTSDNVEIKAGDTYWYFRDKEVMKLYAVSVRSWQDYNLPKGFIQFGEQENAVQFRNNNQEK